MAQKISISIPDELHAELTAWAEQTGGTVSGFFAELARQRLDADRASHERLAALTAKDRAAGPDSYDRRRSELHQRMIAAKAAAVRKKANLA
ncbi:ribbon-helix-helix domain-containing protein [Streptosporangium sp. DT93]|uniref:ribbon-helix-helix domain-containing protein n=1 Tax=Streptosporangium sp. DT93 TaxID=3393428 RepID=UPI003CF477CF